MKLISFLLFIACILLLIDRLTWHADLEQMIMEAIDKNAVLSDMRNAKIDCERVLSRTQECVLIYEYVPVNK